MPYHLEQSGSGYYVVGPSGRHSKKPLPKRRAVLQMRALYAAEKKTDYPNQRQFAGYTMEDWDDTKPDSFYHDTRPATRTKDTCTCATTKGERIAPGITRIRGNLCNVHGRYGPCGAGVWRRLSEPRLRRR